MAPKIATIGSRSLVRHAVTSFGQGKQAAAADTSTVHSGPGRCHRGADFAEGSAIRTGYEGKVKPTTNSG